MDDEAIDKYLNAELIFSVSTISKRQGHVIKHLCNGNPIGHAHSNPLFDIREYEVKFIDRTTNKYQANIIAKNMYAQVNEEG